MGKANEPALRFACSTNTRLMMLWALEARNALYARASISILRLAGGAKPAKRFSVNSAFRYPSLPVPAMDRRPHDRL